MLVKITAQEEPYRPIVTTFQFQNDVLATSADRVKSKLRRNMRINLNETLLLFTEHIAHMLREGKGYDQIKREISGILSSDQVMPGTPEMLRRLDFEILSDHKTEITVNQPIAIPDAARM